MKPYNFDLEKTEVWHTIRGGGEDAETVTNFRVFMPDGRTQEGTVEALIERIHDYQGHVEEWQDVLLHVLEDENNLTEDPKVAPPKPPGKPEYENLSDRFNAMIDGATHINTVFDQITAKLKVKPNKDEPKNGEPTGDLGGELGG